MSDDLTRPIIGIENRTAQEVFDIMADRFRSLNRSAPIAEPVGRKLAHDLTPEQMDKLAFVVFYSPTTCAPENIEAVIKEIDCCPGCEHTSSSGSICYRSERGEYCPNEVAETLRQIGAALHGPRDPSHYVARERLGGVPLTHPSPAEASPRVKAYLVALLASDTPEEAMRVWRDNPTDRQGALKYVRALAPAEASRSEAVELRKIAETLGCADDPFAAWEALEAVLSALRFYADPGVHNFSLSIEDAARAYPNVTPHSMVHRAGLYRVEAREGYTVPLILSDDGRWARDVLAALHPGDKP